MNARHRQTISLAGILAAMLALAGCDQRVGTDRQQIDRDVAMSDPKAADTGRELPPAGDTAPGQAGNAAPSGGTSAGDSAITAAVRAELAKDPALGALNVAVQTTNGRVQLNGIAPNAEARMRATQLAARVEGVSSVDNEMQIAS